MLNSWFFYSAQLKIASSGMQRCIVGFLTSFQHVRLANYF